ncbi:MAG: phosphoglycerate mutase family protein [Bacteriovoracaceae bacterium]
MEPMKPQDSSEKILILLRHGISQPLSHTLNDFNRSLTEQGENAFCEKLEKMNSSHIFPQYNPQIIISSPSKRTHQTAQLFLCKQKLEIPLETNMNLYEQTVKAIQTSIQQSEKLVNSTKTILIVAHNPLIESWAYKVDPQFKNSVTPGTFLFFKSSENSWKNAIENPWSLFLHV